jgi:hypothetical protein
MLIKVAQKLAEIPVKLRSAVYFYDNLNDSVIKAKVKREEI